MTRRRVASRCRAWQGFKELPRNAGDDDPGQHEHDVLRLLIDFKELPRNAGDDDAAARRTRRSPRVWRFKELPRNAGDDDAARVHRGRAVVVRPSKNCPATQGMMTEPLDFLLVAVNPPFKELPRNAGDDDLMARSRSSESTSASFKELPRNAGDDDLTVTLHSIDYRMCLQRTAPQRRG